MNTIVSEPREAGTEGERQVLLLCYILHALAMVGITTIVGVIIDHIKAKETQSPFIRSHHVWLLHTFWWGLLWLAISWVLMFTVSPFGLLLIGWTCSVLVVIWWLYRLIRGALAFAKRRPMPV